MSFCPHCHSGNDPVLKDTTWSCGVRSNDALWRTKECYKRQIHVGDEHLRLQEQHISDLEEENERLNQRIKRLEEALGLVLKMRNDWLENQEDGYEGAYYAFVKGNDSEWEEIIKAKEAKL